MTALDTNVLIALRSSDASANQLAATALRRVAWQGPLSICGAAFAEMLGLPGRSSKDLLDWFAELEITIEWKFDSADWQLAGEAYQGYVNRRRASGGGLPRRIATDFLIGAHAFLRGHTLLTADQRLYGAAFPGLSIASL